MPNSLKALNPRDVQRNLAVMKQMIYEMHPQWEHGRGPFHDLVLYPSAMYTTALQQDLAQAMRGLNMQHIIDTPQDVSNDHVDKAMANWGVRRKRGTSASGTVTIVLDRPHSMVLPGNFTLTANGHRFVTKDSYTVRTATGGAVMLPTDRALVKYGGGWSFTVPVNAVTVGASSNLRRGTQMQFDHSWHNIQHIYATHDFTGGADEESNTEMVQRRGRCASGKVWSNRCTGEALVCDVPLLERAAGVSIVGFGDPEMLRDRHSFWPGSIGGRVDVYVKPTGGILMKDVAVQGQIIDETPEGTRWKLHVPCTAAPGFLYVEYVQRVGGNRCRIVDEVRGIDKAAGTADINNVTEGVYSAYQNATLVILDTNPASGSTFIVSLAYLPGILEAQRIVANRRTASVSCDVLVKAAVPCLTTVEIELQQHIARPQRIDDMQRAIAHMINGTDFIGRLPATNISNIITPFLDGSTVLRHVNMVGKIRCPDGTIKTIQSNNLLTVPNEPPLLVSPRTTAFFQDPNDVHVKVVMADDAGN